MVHTEHIRIDPAYRERLRACGLADVAGVLARIEGRVTAWSRTTETLHVPGPHGQPGFFIKRHYFARWGNRLRSALRGTFFGAHRGLAEYRALNTMRALGVPAVRPVAYGSRRVLHFLTACFLITEETPEAQNLTTFALDVVAGRRCLSRTDRCLVVRTLAEQLAALHATGFWHGNLFWRNVLLRYGPGGRPEFFFLDPQPPHAWERLGAGGGWWSRELAQLLVSASSFTTRTERLRFLRHYLGGGRLTAETKADARAIEWLSHRWRCHETRRIRMTALFEGWNRELAQEEQRLGGAAWAPEPRP
jgi:hypothetical protein